MNRSPYVYEVVDWKLVGFRLDCTLRDTESLYSNWPATHLRGIAGITTLDLELSVPRYESAWDRERLTMRRESAVEVEMKALKESMAAYAASRHHRPTTQGG